MTPISIRLMTPGDLAAADALRAAAGWNQTLQDWRRFLHCEPEGCFIAERDQIALGTATIIRYGSALGWIGMVLVHPDHRRQGVGSALLRPCLAELHRKS